MRPSKLSAHEATLSRHPDLLAERNALNPAVLAAFVSSQKTPLTAELVARIEAFNARCIEIGASLVALRTK